MGGARTLAVRLQLRKALFEDVLVFMKKKPSKHLDKSSPQTVTELMETENGKKTIKIGFTEQRVSPHAGLSTFVSFLHRRGCRSKLEGVLPRRSSPNARPAVE